MSEDIRIANDNTDAVIDEKNRAVLRALTAIGMQCETYAKEIVHVDTGRLRNRITNEVREKEEAVYVGTNVEYAAYVEYGTRRSKAYPYLKPAVQDHVDEYKRIAESYLKG